MKKMGVVLSILDLLFFAVASVSFVVSHDGWKGDAQWTEEINDTIARPADLGFVFFNRWNFYGDEESILTKTFLFANILGFFAGTSIVDLLAFFSDEFGSNQPLGLSRASYTLMLAIPFSLAQWWVVGRLIDKFRRR